MLDREFQTATIRIVTGLEKRVEGTNVTLNIETRNNLEIKDSEKEMRNTLDERNSRMEEAEEQINDIEDKVMESNKVQQNREK